MPLFEATVSEITEPIKASVIAIFSEANRYGADRGMPTLVKISQDEAPSERSTSRISGSIVARPVAMFTAIGKNATLQAVMIAGTVPMPNQITMIGTKATFGIELKPISSG